MNLLKSLFGRLFGKKAPAAAIPEEPAEPAANAQLEQWEALRQRSAKITETALRHWITDRLKEQGDLEFSWDSGNDEAFVTINIDEGQDAAYVQNLEQYIIDKLQIPDAGEFEMTGAGSIFIEGDVVRARYHSTMRWVLDYDEETDEPIYHTEEAPPTDLDLFRL